MYVFLYYPEFNDLNFIRLSNISGFKSVSNKGRVLKDPMLLLFLN